MDGYNGFVEEFGVTGLLACYKRCTERAKVRGLFEESV